MKKEMILSHIVAVSENFVIGKNNRLPWKMPEDTRYFHNVTDGHIVIMGRKNYKANKGALKNRTNIVVTRNLSFNPDDAIVASSIGKAIETAASFHPEEVFIVGGGEIYRQTLDMVQRIYITVIHTTVEGDAFYPLINFKSYHIISEVSKTADRENPFDHTYYILEKPF
ncbi:MAG: dihydrofolate reductase [Bacteroidales bacterium]|nr:dihydrofolate reductase [Bacteroidales bacterium]